MADVRAYAGVPTIREFAGVGVAPSPCAPIVVDSTTGTLYSVKTGDVVVASGVPGTVTSVAETFTGGIISVAGSPITTSGTLALTVAGTSGGIPYFSSSTAWASSAALAANALVIGGGAGAAPSTVTTGANVLTALGIAVGSAGAFVTFNGALGTPSSGTATNLTGTAAGLTAGTASAVAVGGITGLGSNVATFLATPSSANLAAAVTGETGSGALVFATSPALTTPDIGVATGTSLQTSAAVNGLTVGVAQFKSGSWTPSPANLTVVGTPTYTGTYTRIADRVFCTLEVDSTVSTASTANSTAFSGLPYTVAAKDTCTAVSESTASFGVGLVFTDANVYTPTWAATNKVTVSFSYRTTANF